MSTPVLFFRTSSPSGTGPAVSRISAFAMFSMFAMFSTFSASNTPSVYVHEEAR